MGNGAPRAATLHGRLLLAMLLLVSVAAVIFSVAHYREERRYLIEGLDEKLRTAAIMARATLQADFHDRIKGPDSVSDAEYQAIVSRFNDICTALGMEYIWSLMEVDGTIVFTTATSPDKDAKNRKHAAFFESHSNPEIYAGTFASMKPSYQINDDKWGRIRAALIPFRDVRGRPYLFGASIRMTEVDIRLRRVVWENVFLSIGLLLCTFAVSVFLSRSVVKPINRLTEAIKGIAEGESGLTAEERGSYEQVVLAGSFNRLNRNLQEKIAELGRSQEVLTRQTSLLNGLLKSIPDIVFFKDRDGVYMGCNPECARVIGRPEEEIRGLTDHDLFPKAVADIHRENDRLMMEQGLPRQNEEWITYPDGRRVLIDTLKAPLRSIDGTVIGVLGVSRDITERRRMAEAHKVLALRNDAILAAIPDIIMEVDASKRYTWANPAGLRFFGEDVVGREASDYFEGEQDTYDVVAPLFEGVDDVIYVESWQRRKDGEKRLLSWWCKVLKDGQGQVVGALSTARDITEQKEVEAEIRRLNSGLERRVAERTGQLESANRELEAFSYSVSHDLRAPLRHIDGYVDLLLSRCRENLSEKGVHYLDTIADSAKQMGVLIDDLLRFSRTGRAEIRKEEVDMRAALDEALAPLLDAEAAGRKIEWSVGDLPTVRGDRALLRQVWANLIANAVKFTRKREVARIEVGARKDGDEFVFTVADNGVGFEMKHAGKLFGVFQRLHSQGEFEGTGIGLATVQRIVARHGGRAWAEAEPDRGARFHFTIPTTDPEGRHA